MPLFSSNCSEAEQDCWVKTHVYRMGWENRYVSRLKKTKCDTGSFHFINNHRLTGERKLKCLLVLVNFEYCS